MAREEVRASVIGRAVGAAVARVERDSAVDLVGGRDSAVDRVERDSTADRVVERVAVVTGAAADRVAVALVALDCG